MRGRLLGCAFLVCTATAWVTASFLAQFLVSGQQPSLHPLLLCYICTSMFSLYLPILACKRWLGARHTRSSRQEPSAQELLHGTHMSDATGPVLFPQHSRLGAMFKVLPVAVLFFMAQSLFTISLANTSVSSNTILSSSSSMWTLLASALVLGEHITAIKLVSVMAVMTGTAAVTLADSSAAEGGAGDHSLYGDALCVLSAMCYSCYTVTMQHQLREDNLDIPAAFFGYVGVLTAVLGAPVVLVLQLMGSFNVLLLNPTAVGLALLNGLMDYVVADYTWARAVLLLGPTVATLGMSVQVPLATAADAVLGHPHWLDSGRAVALTAGGSVLILWGVWGINMDPHRHSSPEVASHGQEVTGEVTAPLLEAVEEA